MALFTANFRAFQFQSGVDRICTAYRASVAAMEEARREALEAYANYEASGDDDSEYDEDGALIHSTQHALNYAEMDAGLAVAVVREAFITIAFHFWERSARQWTGRNEIKDRYIDLHNASNKMYSISPQLKNLNALNNLIKHGGEENARSLAAVRRDYFRPLFPGQDSAKHQSPTLRLTHEHVEEAFETVRASGPNYAV